MTRPIDRLTATLHDLLADRRGCHHPRFGSQECGSIAVALTGEGYHLKGNCPNDETARFLAERLVNVYGESPSTDYITRILE